MLESEIEATFRGEKSVVRAGETVNISANVPHTFTNASDRAARLLCVCSPSGQEEFSWPSASPSIAGRRRPPISTRPPRRRSWRRPRNSPQSTGRSFWGREQGLGECRARISGRQVLVPTLRSSEPAVDQERVGVGADLRRDPGNQSTSVLASVSQIPKSRSRLASNISTCYFTPPCLERSVTSRMPEPTRVSFRSSLR